MIVSAKGCLGLFVEGVVAVRVEEVTGWGCVYGSKLMSVSFFLAPFQRIGECVGLSCLLLMEALVPCRGQAAISTPLPWSPSKHSAAFAVLVYIHRGQSTFVVVMCLQSMTVSTALGTCVRADAIEQGGLNA